MFHPHFVTLCNTSNLRMDRFKSNISFNTIILLTTRNYVNVVEFSVSHSGIDLNRDRIFSEVRLEAPGGPSPEPSLDPGGSGGFLGQGDPPRQHAPPEGPPHARLR